MFCFVFHIENKMMILYFNICSPFMFTFVCLAIVGSSGETTLFPPIKPGGGGHEHVVVKITLTWRWPHTVCLSGRKITWSLYSRLNVCFWQRALNKWLAIKISVNQLWFLWLFTFINDSCWPTKKKSCGFLNNYDTKFWTNSLILRFLPVKVAQMTINSNTAICLLSCSEGECSMIMSPKLKLYLQGVLEISHIKIVSHRLHDTLLLLPWKRRIGFPPVVKFCLCKLGVSNLRPGGQNQPGKTPIWSTGKLWKMWRSAKILNF